jgi:glycine cleavage system H protein
MPVSGRVLEINDELEDAPEKVNEDAFDAWLVKVELTNDSELSDLMSAEAYEAFIKSE